jgi:ATP-binding cassette subfamily B protein
MSEGKTKANVGDIRLFSSFLVLFRQRRGAAALGMLLAPVQPLLLLPVPLLINQAFGRAIPAQDIGGLLTAGGMIILLAAVGTGVALWSRRIILSVTKKAISQVRKNLFRQLYTMPLGRFNSADHIRFHTLVVHGSERLDVMSNALVSHVLPGIFAVTLIGLLLFFINGILAATVLTLVAVLSVLSVLLSGRVKQEVHRFHDSYDSFSGGVQRALRHYDYARSHGLEEREIERHENVIDGLRRLSARMVMLATAYQAFHGFGVIALGSVILILGGYLVVQGQMTIGDLLAFYSAIALMRPFMNSTAGNVLPVFAGIDSLRSLVQTFDLDVRRERAGRIMEITGRVTAAGIACRYGDEAVLVDAAIELFPGKTTALTGPVGAGKTTLANVILGLYEAEAGETAYDGVGIGELNVAHVRRQVGVVRQNPVLFHGTVFDNIAYGDDEADEVTVGEAARLAGADRFIAQLPNGYATEVGEDAVMLSGGQRQLIAVARALHRKPRLMILDEPGNHLDAASLGHLMASLRSLPWKPAVLLISHEVAQAEAADYHYRLEGGKTRLSSVAPDLEGTSIS